MGLENTLSIIKPDAVEARKSGHIIGLLEENGFEIIAKKKITLKRVEAEKFYSIHKDRPFFNDLVDFISSGPVVAMVWEGEGVISSARKMIGATKPLEAEPGTIRGDLAVNIGRNIIHGSDGPDTASFEINLWFNNEEICDWNPSDSIWRIEN